MSDKTNICLPCGLCCDGTLIGHVQLEREELPDLKKIMDIEDEGGNGFFLQPCKKFCDKCTIYSSRPKQCDHFNCELLNAVNKKELDFDSALSSINLVKKTKKAIEDNVANLNIQLKSESFHFKMVELKTLLQKRINDSSLSTEHRNLISNMEKIDHVFILKFGVSIF